MPKPPYSNEVTVPVGGRGPRDAPSPAARGFLIGLSTDLGPRLLVFTVANVLIGRMPDNHLAINHASVSRRHARIAIKDEDMTVEDLGSQNGTTVNGAPVHGIQPIRAGDIVRLGHVTLFFFGLYDPDRPPLPQVAEQSILVTPSPISLL